MDVSEALELGQSIMDDADDVPEGGEDFAAGVSATTSDIMETIEERGQVTEGQAGALQNMRNGLDKWLR